VYSTIGESLEVSEVIFTEPYGDILITEDGSINLGRVQKGETTGEGNAGDEGVAAESDEEVVAERTDDGLAVTIGRVVVNDASADFADLSLPLPFAAKIAALNGEMSTIATASAEPSTVELEGDVDEFGQVQIGGTVTPLDPPANTDIAVAFRNVDMPKFSAYSIPFAGREIASGRLDLDLGYQIVEGELVGENRIVLRDFELGDKVDHPDALSLPLGLAVALLKDPDGRISLDVPVRGSVDDPEFRIGGVVAKALVNVLTKIVTSPFALLANLVGAEGDELEYLAFAPGRGDLSPPEREKVAKIAEALAMRPQLVLQVSGVYEPGADGAVLRSDMVDARIDERIEVASDGDEEMYADLRREVIEQLFTESMTDTDPAVVLSEVRAATTAVNETGESQFDELAFAEALRDKLVDMQPVTETDLLALAEARAQSVRQAMLESDAGIAARVVSAEAATGESDDDGNIRMQVRLSASEDLPSAPQEAEPPMASMTFDCTDGPTVSVRFLDAGQLHLDDGTEVRTLARVRSASGGRYAGDDVEFWEKGDEAMLSIGDARYDCRKSVNG
jgi:membrane-bound inhibitor of C-type lysozyme